MNITRLYKPIQPMVNLAYLTFLLADICSIFWVLGLIFKSRGRFMNKLFVGMVLLFALNISHAQQMDTNIELIQNAFNAYLEDFIDRDADQIATHFQFPSMNQIGNPARIFHSLEEITKFWETFPLQNGYAYSTVDDMAINRLSNSIYSLVFDYSRYDAADELLYEGSSVYFYGNKSGVWKIFFQSTGDRE